MKIPFRIQVLGFLFISTTSSSEIVFETPAPILPLLTPTLTLRCSLEELASVTDVVVGRREITKTDNEVNVSNIVIKKGENGTVATISQFNPAVGFGNLASMHVSGDVTGKVGQSRYLEVSWDYPSELESGDYRCDINTVNELGQTDVFSKSVSVDVGTPTMHDIVRTIHDLSVENRDLRAELKTLKNETAFKLDQVGETLTRVQHIENGTAWCNKTVTFTLPYDVAPIVHLAIHGVDVYFQHGDITNPSYFARVADVDTHGFRVTCSFYKPAVLTANLFVNWLSLPS